MVLEKVKKQRADHIAEAFNTTMIKHPLFMYFCQKQNIRADFIKDYFKYFIPKWSRRDILLCDMEHNALISIENPDTFKFHFIGQGAARMRTYRNASTVFVHKKNVAAIMKILIPEGMPSRVMNIYTDPQVDAESLNKLIDESKGLADKENFVLAYETFSKKFISYMQSQGFETAYQRPFMNTQFIQTVMTYNLKKDIR